ncbi:DUF5320 family protein [Chloroflexota bacterium]
MPGLDGTGPMGMGPMTGGGRGFCAVPLRSAWPAYTGRGFAVPYAAPLGMSYYGVPAFTPQITREEELEYLQGLAQSMREDLKEIEGKIQQIESKKEEL